MAVTLGPSSTIAAGYGLDNPSGSAKQLDRFRTVIGALSRGIPHATSSTSDVA